MTPPVVDPVALEAVATWLEYCCRSATLAERADIAAQLRLGIWTGQPQRRTAQRDAPRARAQAEEFARHQIERDRRANAARAAAAAGAEPMHDYYGLPRGYAKKSYQAVSAALGIGDPDAALINQYGADGILTVRNGNGVIVDQRPIGKRRDTRLRGHAMRPPVACLRCAGGRPAHPSCECGEWMPLDGCDRKWFELSKARGRDWHWEHKNRLRGVS